MSKIQFRNAAHRDFVLENLDKCKVNDCYHRAFFYVMHKSVCNGWDILCSW